MNRLRNWLLALLAFLGFGVLSASAQTDITGVIDQLTTYRTAAMVVGIALLLWILGRKVVKRVV